MRIYDEIFGDEGGSGFERCVLCLRGGGYFEGVKAVGEFSPERIVLCFSKGEVELLGEGFTVQKYCDGDLRLLGKITQWRTLGGDLSSR